MTKSPAKGVSYVMTSAKTKISTTKYVMVSEPDSPKPDEKKKDEKNLAITPLKTALHNAMPLKKGKGGGKNLPPVRAKIWQSGAAAGSSNTAYTTVVTLAASLCTEFTNYAALYDECRVRGVTCYFATVVAVASGSQPVTMHFNLGYDPIDNTAYASILKSLMTQQKTGLRALNGQFGTFGATSSWTVSPVAHTPTGFWKFHFKHPSGPHAAMNTGFASSTFYVEGMWYPCSNITSGDDIYGFLKPYAEALANSTFQWEYFLEFDMEFRSRT